MREILFRGKQIDTNEWVYGNLVTDAMTGNRASIITFADLGEKISNRGAYVWEHINPATIGQFAGMVDSNNVKIFEGDIVQVVFSKRPVIRKIVFHNGSFRFVKGINQKNDRSKILHPTTVYNYEIIVIGNIHDKQEYTAFVDFTM